MIISYKMAKSSSEVTGDERDYEATERTSLLPPSGISTNEREEKISNNSRRHKKKKSRRMRQYNSNALDQRQKDITSNMEKNQWDNTHAQEDPAAYSKRKMRKKKYKSSRRKSRYKFSPNESSDSGASDSSMDYRRWAIKRARMLEKESAKNMEQWKAAFLAKEEKKRQEEEKNRRRFSRWFAKVWSSLIQFIGSIEMFIANLPLAIGAVALAIVTLGVVWFKFAEENLSTCERVHFHSSQCTFPEFPGCFYCDTNVPLYRVALNFHYGCNVVAGVLAFLFVAKILLATRVVVDEMASPVTASPAGLLCMTTVCVFAGRGLIGQIMVSVAASVHLGLVIWYIYMALAYQIMPEPTWFPNTVGVGLSAVKTWLYYPMPGHLLMGVS